MTQIDTSGIIRLGAGQLSPTTILGSSSYLISSFPVPSDSVQREWQAKIGDEGIQDPANFRALDGSGKAIGTYSGSLHFEFLSTTMLNYLWTNIFQSLPIADVTLVAYHSKYGVSAFVCKMEYPSNMSQAGEHVASNIWHDVSFNWYRGTRSSSGFDSGFDEGFF